MAAYDVPAGVVNVERAGETVVIEFPGGIKILLHAEDARQIGIALLMSCAQPDQLDYAHQALGL